MTSSSSVSVPSVPSVPLIQLNSGHQIPIFGLGTWKSSPGVVKEVIKNAIDVGYRHIDCAYVYGNEAEIGSGIQDKIQEGVIQRNDLFLTSKVWNTFHSKVEECLKDSLTKLGTDYIDLYLIHWPFGYQEDGDIFPRDDNGDIILSDVDYVDTWKQMEVAFNKGMIKSIGLSNFNSQQIQTILDICTIKPSVLQIECHPNLNQKKLVEFCKSQDIVVTAYSPLGSPDRPWAKADDPKLLDDPKLIQLAEKHSKSPAQIILRWLIQRGIVAIPKTSSKDRLTENLNIFDFSLSEDDVAIVDSMDCNGRLVVLSWISASKYYPFNIEF